MNSILFNEELVNAQCRKCNQHGGGELQMYKKVLIDIHGQEKWDYWQSIKNTPEFQKCGNYQCLRKTTAV
jgi:hypothetical protein